MARTRDTVEMEGAVVLQSALMYLWSEGFVSITACQLTIQPLVPVPSICSSSNEEPIAIAGTTRNRTAHSALWV